uniref:Mu-like prophage protein gp29 n=1 Tax=Candidatus Kentrum sp. LFY TaxID=2126342 RepID=A0A450V4P4_9GAMM|nr:MAG: Mu-like prophage protein gp29 [Candidatus Kentron sp. LFY]
MIEWLKKNLSKITRPKTTLQAGARSTQGHTLNYASTITVDPSRLAQAFAQADTGTLSEQSALFEMIEEHDAHIYSELAKRRRAVTSIGWGLNPPKDASQSEIDRTTELKDMLDSIHGFENAQYDLTDAIGKGFANMEIDWRTGSEWVPNRFIWVPQRLFQVDDDTGEMQFLKNGIPEPLRPYGWVTHEHRAKSGYIEQTALFRVLAWTYAYKAYDIKDMQRFLEVYGLPLRLGKYTEGVSSESKKSLLKAVRNIGNDGAGIIPANMAIEFVEAKKTGSVNDFLDTIIYWERKQSLAILGGTLTSQADGKTSTNALGEVHEKQRSEIRLHDVGQIDPTVNHQIVRPIALINGMFPKDRLPTYHHKTEDPVNKKNMVDMLLNAVEIGMEIDIDWAHHATQIPRASDKATLLKAPGTTPKADLARLVALAHEKEHDESIPDAYTEQLAKLSARHEKDFFGRIANIIENANDFDDAMKEIDRLKIENETWAQDIALGTMAADLAGRVEIGNE